MHPAWAMLEWTDQSDGSRVRVTNGIRIVDRTARPPENGVEHLVTWREDAGTIVVLGLDKACRPVTLTTM
jgi:hypothetical protein